MHISQENDIRNKRAAGLWQASVREYEGNPTTVYPRQKMAAAEGQDVAYGWQVN